jgi:hypothetical protein
VEVGFEVILLKCKRSVNGASLFFKRRRRRRRKRRRRRRRRRT